MLSTGCERGIDIRPARDTMREIMNYWLVKQEPEEYSWAQFVRDDGTAWTGIRNFQARNHLCAMQPGDRVLFYQSGGDKMVLGIAKVTRAAYPDQTATEGSWFAVNLAPVRSLALPVTLGKMKQDPALKDLPLLKQPRLSVVPVTEEEYLRIAELAQTRP